MKKSAIILLHLGYWLLYIFLFSFLFILSETTNQSAFEHWDDWIAILLLAFLNGLASFYTFYNWLVPHYLANRQIKQFIGLGIGVSIGISLVLTIVVSLAINVLIYIFLHEIWFITFPPESWPVLIIGFTFLALINGIISTVMRGFVTWYGEIHLKEVTAHKTLRTEFALLKAQLNPHFLFNTLNNIDILIGQDAVRASLYLTKLSDMLRFVLYDTQADQILLTQELEYIQKYIELQKLRTTNEKYVAFEIDGQPNKIQIPPMLFIPFIENAFKYASNKRVSEAISIHISITQTHIHFRCINVIDLNDPVSRNYSGLGHELIRQRLLLLYQEKFNLVTHVIDHHYYVYLDLPIKAYELSAH
ncbi:sensor histidine kinase [Xanthocytophaga agilis]|uniref:Sensor histidine kinase n=1 Tax=Xanthocytophaga agilis TaxID=3048010 RepID=A0AAE3R1L8_9BACT|nr:sensor histidine kinase [Xanthocytophaga agilis]MDJ1499969.1 sensor histidine kinase [Xanthocytophaga agilis]